jgi:hypothetical protein
MERDDLTAPVVPGGDEFSLGYRAVSEERLGHWDRPPDHGTCHTRDKNYGYPASTR